jgi:conjugative transfer region protein (TIGR03750 family)
MNAHTDVLADGTLRFLPNRLNRQPIVVLGLTADELWISVGISALLGLGLGVALAIATRSFATGPTAVAASVGLGIFLGGRYLRRLKRGKPQTWLYRHMQWVVRRRWPVLAAWTGGMDLVVRSGAWSVRRSERK